MLKKKKRKKDLLKCAQISGASHYSSQHSFIIILNKLYIKLESNSF